MPEGHTIHRAARDHERALGGQRVRLSSPQGRVELGDLVDVDGRAALLRVEAHGKHLFYVFGGRRFLHVHLGLFGKFFRRRSPAPPPRATTRLRLEGAATTIDLVGPTACEVLTPRELASLTARLGPDPLRAGASPDALVAYAARARAPIGAVLLDQRVIAGVGNVYRAELLHLLGLHPLTPAREVAPGAVVALWDLAAELLQRGVDEGRIVTARERLLERPGARAVRHERTNVYGRATCRTCGGPVTREPLGARVIHFCPSCQPIAVTR